MPYIMEKREYEFRPSDLPVVDVNGKKLCLK
jgi:hypothetical protein